MALLESQVSKLWTNNQIPKIIKVNPASTLTVKILISGKAIIIKPRNMAKIPNNTFFPSATSINPPYFSLNKPIILLLLLIII